jgi:hypothetical protein
MTVEALPQSTFVLLKHRDDNRAKIHPKMYHALDTRTIRDTESKCLTLAVDNWSTVAGSTLGSSKSCRAVAGTSPHGVQVSSASNSDDLTPLDNHPQSTSSSEPELAGQEGLCFFQVQLPPNSALALASIISSYFIAVSVNMKPSSSSLTSKILVNHLTLEHRRVVLQERIRSP